MSAAFVVAGLLWLARGVVQQFEPRYWSPSTPLDYAAVALSSVALLAAALALGALVRHTWLSGPARAALGLASLGSLVAGVSNFLEDWLRLAGFGAGWVAGAAAFGIGMLATSLALLAARHTRTLGAALLCVPLAFFLGDRYSGLAIGAALVAVGVLLALRARRAERARSARG